MESAWRIRADQGRIGGRSGVSGDRLRDHLAQLVLRTRCQTAGCLRLRLCHALPVYGAPWTYDNNAQAAHPSTNATL